MPGLIPPDDLARFSRRLEDIVEGRVEPAQGMLVMKDDRRMELEDGERLEEKAIRFRTLGCYPLTGAVESDAKTLPEIIQEMVLARTSERSGRAIDDEQSYSIEKKKREGYF